MLGWKPWLSTTEPGRFLHCSGDTAQALWTPTKPEQAQEWTQAQLLPFSSLGSVLAVQGVLLLSLSAKSRQISHVHLAPGAGPGQ